MSTLDIKFALISTDEFSPWLDYQHLLKVTMHESGTCVYVELKRCPNSDIKLSNVDIEMAVEKANSLQNMYHLSQPKVTSGSPEGGVIQIMVEKIKPYNTKVLQ